MTFCIIPFMSLIHSTYWLLIRLYGYADCKIFIVEFIEDSDGRD